MEFNKNKNKNKQIIKVDEEKYTRMKIFIITMKDDIFLYFSRRITLEMEKYIFWPKTLLDFSTSSRNV